MKIIDSDVHYNYRRLPDLLPWLERAHHDFVLYSGFGGYSVPNFPWMKESGFSRSDAVPSTGGPPGSDLETLKAQHLDAFDIEYAILNGDEILNVSAIPNPHIAAALAAAHNGWLIDEWLPQDSRLKGSITVAPQEAELAAKEIRRAGNHRDIVQVLMPTGAPAGYGDPRYHPIYEAAVEIGLPVAIHVGADGCGVNPPPSAVGYPTYYPEWHALLPTVGWTHVVSLICNGVFEKYRDLRFHVLECGTAWLPAVLWRLDAEWKANRTEIPWVSRLPSETVRERMRFTTQPLEEPGTGRHLTQVLETIEGFESMLMFASDYPHHDFEGPEQILRRLPGDWREAVAHENARSAYGLKAGAAEAEPAGASS